MKYILLLLALLVPTVTQAQEMYLTVFTTEAEGLFNNHPGLFAFRKQCKYGTVHADSVMYRERYADQFQSPPVALLQEADGTVVTEVNVAMSPDELNEHLMTAAERFRCGPRGCPTPETQPEPPQPPRPEPPRPYQPQPQPQPQPVLRTVPTPSVPFWVLGLLAVVGAGAGVIEMYHSTHKGQ
jgi:hypothetical protein